MYARTVFDPLAIITANGHWAPYLAQSITPNADYTSWTITLRPTVALPRRHAVQRRRPAPNFEAYHTTFLDRDRAQARGPDNQADRPTVGAGEPQAPVGPVPLLPGRRDRRPDRLGDGAVDDQRQDRRHRQPGRHGPVQVHKVDPQHTLHRHARSENYWRKGSPTSTSITFKPIVDYTSRADALESGTHRHDDHRRAPEHRRLPGQAAVVVRRRQRPGGGRARQ